jgi:type IV secretory pathway component VirB8
MVQYHAVVAFLEMRATELVMLDIFTTMAITMAILVVMAMLMLMLMVIVVKVQKTEAWLVHLHLSTKHNKYNRQWPLLVWFQDSATTAAPVG